MIDPTFLALVFILLAVVLSLALVWERTKSGKGLGLNFVVLLLASLLIPSAGALALMGMLKGEVAVFFSALAGGLISLLTAKYKNSDIK